MTKKHEQEDIDTFFIIRNKQQPKTTPHSLSIPRRPRENPNKNITSSSTSPITTSTAASTPPPLPPPLVLPQLHSKQPHPQITSPSPLRSTRYTSPLPLLSNQSTRPLFKSDSPIIINKKNSHRLSPLITPLEREPDNILVPDSTDSPQNSPIHSAIVRDHYNQSDLESDLEIEKHVDPLPKLLFNPPLSSPVSAHNPSKFFLPHSIPKHSTSNSTTSIDDSRNVDEEEKRERLILELGFDTPSITDNHEPVAPLSSSPIEIIQNTRIMENASTKNEKKKQSNTLLRDKGKNKSNDDLEVLCEWQDQNKIQTIELSSSHTTTTSTSKRPESQHRFFATPQDQMKHIGVIVDDSDEEDGEGTSSGIAPLMNSWPASKRTIFMKMAGLKAKDLGEDEAESKADRDKEVAEWDRLLNRRKSTTTSTTPFGNNKKTGKIRKTWNNRAFFKSRKKKNSSSSLVNNNKSSKTFPIRSSSSRFKK